MNKFFVLLSLFFFSVQSFAKNNHEETVAQTHTIVGACNYGLGFFNYVHGCVVSWSQDQIVDYGIRIDRSVYTEDATSLLAIVAIHPAAGSFYFEAGLGVVRKKNIQTFSNNSSTLEHTNENKKDKTEFAALFRLGNRWILPFGMTLGLNYLGISTGGFLTISPEIGWSF